MSKQNLTPINIPAYVTQPLTPTPKQGDAYFNTSDLNTYIYNGTVWIAVGTGSGGGSGTGENVAWWLGI